MLLVISHVEDAFDPRYVPLQQGATYVITGQGQGVVLLDAGVASPHARITIRATDVLVEDLGGGTYVDDRRIGEPTVVGFGDPIRVSETLLTVTLGERVPVSNLWEQREPSATESGFLTALRVNPADDGTRAVYADWLEGEGHRLTAHFIRQQLADNVDVRHDERLGNSLTITHPTWRALIDRGPIGGCRIAGCPRRWHLLRTVSDTTRTCTACSQQVHYCGTYDEAGHHGTTRARVVFDAGLGERYAADRYFQIFRMPGAYDEHGDTYARLFEPVTGRWAAVRDDDDEDF